MCVEMLRIVMRYNTVNSMGCKNTLNRIATAKNDNRLLWASQRVLLI